MANTGELPPRITEDLGHPMVEHSTPKPRAFESTSFTLNGILQETQPPWNFRAIFQSELAMSLREKKSQQGMPRA